MKFSLTVLGTSGAVPTPGRYCSGVFLRTETTDVLIDCGEGTQLRLQDAGLAMSKCAVVLISHLHGDHYFGLPGLLSSLSLSGRKAPLLLICPQDLRSRIEAMLELDRYPMRYELTFRTYEANALEHVLDVGDLEIHAFPLRHRIPTNGYLLREKARPANILKAKIEEYAIPWPAISAIKSGGDFTAPDGQVIPHTELTTPAPPPRSFAYCSDTIYFPELADYVRGTDLLYHEATFLSDMKEDALKKGHSTAHQAALTARDAGAGRLIMGHFSTRYDRVDDHEKEAREVFPASDAARDLWSWEVNRDV